MSAQGNGRTLTREESRVRVNGVELGYRIVGEGAAGSRFARRCSTRTPSIASSSCRPCSSGTAGIRR